MRVRVDTSMTADDVLILAQELGVSTVVSKTRCVHGVKIHSAPYQLIHICPRCYERKEPALVSITRGAIASKDNLPLLGLFQYKDAIRYIPKRYQSKIDKGVLA